MGAQRTDDVAVHRAERMAAVKAEAARAREEARKRTQSDEDAVVADALDDARLAARSCDELRAALVPAAMDSPEWIDGTVGPTNAGAAVRSLDEALDKLKRALKRASDAVTNRESADTGGRRAALVSRMQAAIASLTGIRNRLKGIRQRERESRPPDGPDSASASIGIAG